MQFLYTFDYLVFINIFKIKKLAIIFNYCQFLDCFI